mmetsp:Transcript_19858/g.65659  ORF Transcript_19858/g.65659 Transcript_19858/m.65659 type:complete len:393 (-) Transcript_19858:193-1371(-)
MQKSVVPEVNLLVHRKRRKDPVGRRGRRRRRHGQAEPAVHAVQPPPVQPPPVPDRQAGRAARLRAELGGQPKSARERRRLRALRKVRLRRRRVAVLVRRRGDRKVERHRQVSAGRLEHAAELLLARPKVGAAAARSTDRLRVERHAAAPVREEVRRRAEDRDPLGVVAQHGGRAVAIDGDQLHKVALREALVEGEEASGARSGGVLHHRRELDVQVRREPVVGLEVLEQLLAGGRAEGAVPHLVAQKGLFAEQRVCVAHRGDVGGPVVREEDVHRQAELEQPEHLDLSDVVRGPHVRVGVGRRLAVAGVVVAPVVDAAQPSDADASHRHHARVPEEVDVGRDPAAVVELPEVGGRLVVAADEDREDGRTLLARVVPVKVLHRAVLCWACHRR